MLEGFLAKFKIWTTPVVKSASNFHDAFPCAVERSSAKPTTVHRLRPGDIDVVGAMGDSITGGNGILADSILGLLRQWRGRSWSIGGDGNFLSIPTIPNFLRLANSQLTGYSLKTGYVDDPNAHLNVAEAGAKSADLVQQARTLIQRMKEQPSIDYVNDWKLLTLFIGGNDLCDCSAPISPEEFQANLREALDALHAEVPRGFVNLVEIQDVSALADLNQGLVCSIAHEILCPCVAYPDDSAERRAMQLKSQLYQNLTERLVASGRYDTRDDFTVVLQPFFKRTRPPKDAAGRPDLRYFAPDCFHFSALGHASAAEALWNNMIEPVGHKRTDWAVGEPLQCPVAGFPFLSTGVNSEGRSWKSQLAGARSRFGLSGQAASSSDSNSFTGVVVAVVGVCLLVAAVFVVVIRKRRFNGYTRVDSSGASASYTAQMDDTTALLFYNRKP